MAEDTALYQDQEDRTDQRPVISSPDEPPTPAPSRPPWKKPKFLVGLIGGVRVYIKWQSGDQDTQKAIMGWFGACLFLILVGVVIKAFFA